MRPMRLNREPTPAEVAQMERARAVRTVWSLIEEWHAKQVARLDREMRACFGPKPPAEGEIPRIAAEQKAFRSVFNALRTVLGLGEGVETTLTKPK